MAGVALCFGNRSFGIFVRPCIQSRVLMGKKVIIFVFFAALVLLASHVDAQCAMCKAGVESASKSGSGEMVRALNNGILYLFILPYSAIILLGTVYFLRRRKMKIEQMKSQMTGEHPQN